MKGKITISCSNTHDAGDRFIYDRIMVNCVPGLARPSGMVQSRTNLISESPSSCSEQAATIGPLDFHREF